MVFKKQEAKEEIEEEAKPEVKEAVLTEVPVQMGVAVKLETGEIVDNNELLIRLYNDIQKIKKAVV